MISQISNNGLGTLGAVTQIMELDTVKPLLSQFRTSPGKVPTSSSISCSPDKGERKEMKHESTRGLIPTLSRVNSTILESLTGQNCKCYQGRVAAFGVKVEKENQQAKNRFLRSSQVLPCLLDFP